MDEDNSPRNTEREADMELIIIAVLVLETSILFGWCMSQRSNVHATAEMCDYWHSQANVLSEELHEMRDYWQSQANVLSEELHEMKEENCSLGQLLDDYKRTIKEQNTLLSQHEKTLHNVR